MKKHLLYLLGSLALVSLALIFSSSADEANCGYELLKSSSGAKTRTNSTNFPGTCITCHDAGTPKVQPTWLSTDIPSSGYIAGQTYNITVYTEHINAVGNLSAFALSCEDDATSNNSGIFDDSGSDIQQPASGCITSSSTGNIPNGNGVKSWTIPWTAPSSGTGSITFYSCMVTGENGGGSNGFSWRATLNISEDVSTSIENMDNNDFISIYPNPSNSIVNISFEQNYLQNCEISIVSILGKRILEKEIINSKFQLDVSTFDKGLYYIVLNSSEKQIVTKFIKD